MPKLSKIHRDYRGSDPSQELMGAFQFIDSESGMFLCRSGAIGLAGSLRGKDYDCLDRSQLDYVSRLWVSSIRQFGPDIEVNQYAIKTMCPDIPRGVYDDPEVDRLAGGRIDQVRSRSDRLYSLELFVVVLIDGQVEVSGSPLSKRKTPTMYKADLVQSAAMLRHKFAGFSESLGSDLALRELGKGETFNFFRRLVNSKDKAHPRPLRGDDEIDFHACDSSVELIWPSGRNGKPHLLIDGVYTQVLTAKTLPKTTDSNMLKVLYGIPCDCIIASRWRAESPADSVSDIRLRQMFFFATAPVTSLKSVLSKAGNNQENPNEKRLEDAGKVSLYEQCNVALKDMEENGTTYGNYSLYVAFYGEEQVVRRAVVEANNALAMADGAILEDHINLLNAFRSIQPGNGAFDKRFDKTRISNRNYAEMALTFALDSGNKRNEHLDAEYLAVFETKHNSVVNAGTPYYLNLVYQDVQHMLMDGATGSGKTTLLKAFVANAQKYKPITFVFDMKRSFESLAERFGGASVSFSRGDCSINPFSLPGTKENIQFLSQFVRVLIEASGGSLTSDEAESLHKNIGVMYRDKMPLGIRRLSTVQRMLGPKVSGHLNKWCQGGQYGRFFDNAEDTITLKRFQSFEFEGLGQYKEVVDPLLFYVLHRVRQVVFDPAEIRTFKLLVLDEAWGLIQNPLIKAYVEEAIRTYRDRNTAMMICTQSFKDLEKHGLLDAALDCCANRVFLAHHRVDREEYRTLAKLNDAAIDALEGLQWKREFLLATPSGSHVLQFNASSEELEAYGK